MMAYLAMMGPRSADIGVGLFRERKWRQRAIEGMKNRDIVKKCRNTQNIKSHRGCKWGKRGY
jgi:hypothetical protein